MFDVILSVLTGGATGILRSLISTGVSFATTWGEEKKADGEHRRTIEMTRLQSELRPRELETEREIVMEEQAGEQRATSYRHDVSAGISYPWVDAILQLVRPALTVMLITMVWYIYATSEDLGQREVILNSVIYMASTAVLWWFGNVELKALGFHN